MVGFFVAVFLAVGFFAGVDEGFFALGVVFGLGLGLGLPGAVLFWRVEVVFELFAFAFGVVVDFFLGGIILQCHELLVVRGQEPDTIRDYFQHLLG